MGGKLSRAALGDNATRWRGSGIRNGRDVFKALQAGADAVLLGRPDVWGLAARGVAHGLRLMRDEREAAMALCATLEAIRAGR